MIESEALLFEIAESLLKQTEGLDVELYFKASFDKANRSSIEGFRGPGMEEGLRLLQKVRDEFGLKLVTDFHEPSQAEMVASVVDMLQIPAFLCRQTDLIQAGAKAALKYGRRLNIKKGQFLAPWDAKNIVEKVHETAKLEGLTPSRSDWLLLTERGVSFGYNRLVVDMISFQEMKRFGVETVYDATHSIQLPGAGIGGKSTGGQRQYLEVLARAAFAAGAEGLFMECHPRPAEAKSDGPNAFYLEHVGAFVRQILELREWSKTHSFLLPEAKQ